MTTEQLQDVAGWLQSHADEMTETLQRLVDCESPSSDRDALARAFRLLAETLEGLDYEVLRLPGVRSGDHLEAHPRWGADTEDYQLLVGHMDTVWPLGTVDERPATRAGDELAGPGAFDMKGGLVQMLFALRALRERDLAPAVAPVVLINSDEEVGSRESRPHLVRLAERAVRAFVLEPPFGAQGRLKTSRKGIGRFTVTITGKASHAGLAPEAGVSAILEASHQVQRLFELNDPERGITVNVGTIDGGMGPNVVAPEVTAVVEVRVPTARDGAEIEQALHGLTPVQEGATVTVQGAFGRPPLEPTQRNVELWDAARQAADELGFALSQAAVGGASDGNTTSLYTATLDGLGAVGAGAHAVDEHVVLTHMPQRAALLAALLMLPAPDPTARTP
ncbi:M20 family metallopeptidase [Paraconexibacter sp.]|uniref:M20 family metallopeptidase n=1 Tax=Paraconexibacter sp. TaxID=2949640 RepID=UPI003569026C